MRMKTFTIIFRKHLQNRKVRKNKKRGGFTCDKERSSHSGW